MRNIKLGGRQVGRKRNSKRTRCTYPEKGLGLFGLFRLAPGELSPGENPVKVTLDQAPVLSCHSLPGTQLGSLAASWWPKPHALQMRFLPPAEPPPPTALATRTGHLAAQLPPRSLRAPGELRAPGTFPLSTCFFSFRAHSVLYVSAFICFRSVSPDQTSALRERGLGPWCL